MIGLEEAVARLQAASAYELAATLPYVVSAGAVAAEVAWLARRPGGDRSRVLARARTATAMAGGALVVGIAYTATLGWLWTVVATVRWGEAAAVWEAEPVLGAVVAFVAWDLVGWIYHLIGHRTRVGWAAHQPHHSGTEFDLTLGLRQTWTPVHGLVVQPLLALAGFDLATVVVCAAVSNCWQVLEHTSARLAFPTWFAAVVMTPAAHRHHHGRDAGAVNLGPVLTCWDRLAGTWVPADQPAPDSYGSDQRGREGAVAIELAGWRQLFGRQAMELECSEYGAATASLRAESQLVMSVAAAGRHRP